MNHDRAPTTACGRIAADLAAQVRSGELLPGLPTIMDEVHVHDSHDSHDSVHNSIAQRIASQLPCLPGRQERVQGQQFGLRTLRISSLRKAFTLMELLMVISIITLLAAVLLPAMQMVRKSVNRTVCANNLRQIGICDEAYSIDNEGRLAPRDSGHCQGSNRLAYYVLQAFQGILDTPPARFWYCPEYYMRKSGADTRRPGYRSTSSDLQSNINWGIFSYAFYRWSESMSPSVPGVYSQEFGGNGGNEILAEHVRADSVRIGEFYAPQWNYDSSDGWITGWWHLKNGSLAGGNVLMGDLSVHWSNNFYSNQLTYVRP